MGSTVRYFRAEQWLDDGAPAEDAGRRPGKGDPALPRRCRTGGAGITAACRQGHGLRLICGAGEASRRAVRLRRQPRNCGGVGLLRVTSIIDIPGVEAQRGVHRRLGTRRAERQQGFDRRGAALRCRPFAEPDGRRPRAADAACRPAADEGWRAGHPRRALPDAGAEPGGRAPPPCRAGAASDVCAAGTHCDTTDTGLEGAPHRGEGQAEHDQASAESQAGA